MLELVYANRTENLLHALASDLGKRRAAGGHPLEPTLLVVPNANMETWVRFGLAQALGVAAGLSFQRLERFVGTLVAGAGLGLRLVDLDVAEALILDVLLDEDALASRDLAPVKRYLEGAGEGRHGPDGADLRRVQLAGRLAHLFQEYAYARPEMIAAWRAGRAPRGAAYVDPAARRPDLADTVAWQRAVWRRVFGEGGLLARHPPPDGERWTTLDVLAADEAAIARLAAAGAGPVHVFGVSYVARLFQGLFGRLGEAIDLKIYALNPCAEYWEDVETDREMRRRLDRARHARRRRIWAGSGETEDEDPFALVEADTPALRQWGRPGREHVRLLGELTECDFRGAFSDPRADEDSLLRSLQHDILVRAPGPEQPVEIRPPDESIRIFACPSVRREVETVADAIWRLVEEDGAKPGEAPLRFNDIAVIVSGAARETYLPQIEAVFSAAHDIPRSVSDLPAAAASRLVEAALLLLDLPFGTFTRTEMLRLMTHPAVIGRFDDVAPDDFVTLADRLGVVFGADATDHAGTYIDRDVYHWDQAVRRLALGAFMTGGRSGDERIFESAAGRWLVEEPGGVSGSVAGRFALLARSLLADARHVRRARLPLSEWARFHQAQVDAYLCSENDADAYDRLRILGALARLERLDVTGRPVSGRVAAELFRRALGELSGGRGRYLAEGVVVSSFLPMRAIPFRAVFILGLGEGVFPASNRRDALDLRQAVRRAGDVDPAERDRYMFLETLLCTRDRLHLSYVHRDEQTGDRLEPSAVVQELVHMLEKGYLGPAGARALRMEPPLRRFDPRLHRDVFPNLPEALRADPEAAGTAAPPEGTWLDDARAEARAHAAGLGLRRATGWEAAGDLPRLSRVLGESRWRPLARLLGLADRTPPTRDGRPADDRLSLSLTAVRRFLECPMQGWARTLLGLADDDGDDLADREIEDLALSRPAETVLLRGAFVDAVCTGRDPAEVYAARAERLQLRGEMPVGPFGRHLRARHLEVLAGWRRLLDETGGSLERHRFGRAQEGEQVEHSRDVIPIEVVLEEGGSESRRVVVELHGRTDPVLADGKASFVFQPTPPKGRIDDAVRMRYYRYLLRGVVDHLALSAAGVAGGGSRQALVCLSESAEKTAVHGLVFAPLSVEAAHAHLAALLRDLFGRAHAYFLPGEVACLEAHRLRGRRAAGETDAVLDGEALVRRAREIAENDRTSVASKYGPVPRPVAQPVPAAEDAAEWVSRRYALLVDHVIETVNLP